MKKRFEVLDAQIQNLRSPQEDIPPEGTAPPTQPFSSDLAKFQEEARAEGMQKLGDELLRKLEMQRNEFEQKTEELQTSLEALLDKRLAEQMELKLQELKEEIKADTVKKLEEQELTVTEALKGAAPAEENKS